MEWIGSQISPSTDPDSDDEGKNFPERPNLSNPTALDKSEDVSESHEPEHGAQTWDKKIGKVCANGIGHLEKRHRKMQEWWKDERIADMRKEPKKSKILEMKLKRGVKLPHFDLGRRFYFYSRKKSCEQNERNSDANGEFSFRREFRKKETNSYTSDMWSGDIFSRELSSTTSMRGTLCYVAPEYNGCEYSKEQATLCINLALICLQKSPELRPDIGETVKILKGEMDVPPLALKFSPSPPSKIFGRSRRKQKTSTELDLNCRRW